MDETTKRLIEQARELGQLKEQVLGPSQAFLKDVRQTLFFPPDIGMSSASALLITENYVENLAYSFDRETEVARERLREIAILKPPNQLERWRFDTSQFENFALTAKSFQERFRSPELAELQTLTARVLKEALTPLAALQPNIINFEQILKKVETPWIDRLKSASIF